MEWDVHAYLRTKRDGQPHPAGEIRAFVERLARRQIPDYQTAAWLMATFIHGLNEEELLELTLAMATAGTGRSDPPLFPGTIDKHSTGGVGDTVTLLFLPICAAAGMRIVKLSGRGLGFTGGTLDKLESIPGFRTDLGLEELHQIADRIGCAQGGQSEELAPADKVLYALRDATETVEHPALIASSVMSKKLAAGAESLVLDVKWGNGAFLQELGAARELARRMVEIGRGARRKVSALLTDMNQPLSRAVGNALEVRAALDELRSGCQGRLGRVAVALAQEAAHLAGADPEEPTRVAQSGAAFRKALEWIEAQGGRVDPNSPTYGLAVAPVRKPVFAERNGFVVGFDTRGIGEVARRLGAGRLSVDDVIHPAVGVELHVEIGSELSSDAPWATVHAHNAASAEEAETVLAGCLIPSEQPPDPAHLPPLVQRLN
ncbi:MAG: thymidine phosphorylase [Fimbriimonadales bacterium]|nr:MAG: thymidine phosphorylase [Fimbriimonadales bacterium]